MKRDSTLGVRLSWDERRLINAAASMTGETASGWLRMLALSSARIIARDAAVIPEPKPRECRRERARQPA